MVIRFSKPSGPSNGVPDVSASANHASIIPEPKAPKAWCCYLVVVSPDDGTLLRDVMSSPTADWHVES